MSIMDKIMPKKKDAQEEVESKSESQIKVESTSQDNLSEESEIDINDYETFLMLKYDYAKERVQGIKSYSKKSFFIQEEEPESIDMLCLVVSAKDNAELEENLDFAFNNCIKGRKTLIKIYISSAKFYEIKIFIFDFESNIDDIKKAINEIKKIEFTSEKNKKYPFESIASNITNELKKLGAQQDKVKLDDKKVYKICDKKIIFVGNFRFDSKSNESESFENDILYMRNSAEITSYIMEEDLSIMFASYSIRNIYLLDRQVLEGGD